jgi:hypothetical protein
MERSSTFKFIILSDFNSESKNFLLVLAYPD